MKAYRLQPALACFLSISLILVGCNDDEIAPRSSPQNVSASPGEGEVTISWNAVEGALSYNIYWSRSTVVTTINGTLISNAVSPLTHAGLSFGATYYYIVIAVNGAGEGIPSGEVNATLRPVAPHNVRAFPSAGEVTIRWINVFGATTYNLYWAETTGVTTTGGILISDATSPQTHTGLILGRTYYYIVTAENGGGESDPSDEVSATIPPEAPQNIGISISGDQVTISWDSVTGAATYKIYWLKNSPANMQK